jgi:broad specificity phosphatase PhoE
MGLAELVLVRHGESVANQVASAAEATGSETIDVGMRDADVPLSDTGVEQARALGKRLARLPGGDHPEAVWVSPYLRARQTAQIALEHAGLQLPVLVDERLRDRELGVLDLLTTAGVMARYPEEAARRKWLGKFYHRPPGGESWADVALRLRSLLGELDQRAAGRRVMLVAHDAIIVITRYICEQLSEEQVLELTRTSTIRNGSITRLVPAAGSGPVPAWTTDLFNDVSHLEEHGVEVTHHSGDPHVKPH